MKLKELAAGLRQLAASPVIYLTGGAHHGFLKIARMTGLGRGALRTVAMHGDLKMDLVDLAQKVAEDRKSGLAPLMVVGTAGTTAAGVIDPLPDLVRELRAAFWPHLLPVARGWADRVGRPAPWPDSLEDWLEQCHTAGQTRPTPLLLRYGPGDWNALHRDLYGDLVFPLQVVVGLDRPGVDYQGGEFLTVEQRARAQSRGTTSAIAQGEALVFTTRDRPVPSKRGWSPAPMRHGVSVLRSGLRRTLGLVFHDAQ